MKRQHINMDNYEEYFLLYVDNELTGADKASVEEFVKMHPELKSELDGFLGTKLDVDEIFYEGKDQLMRSEHHIHEATIEELQMMWLDNELDASKAAEVEAYTNAHKSASDNMEWLKKAKLQDEQIIFPNKSSLYRSEKKPAVVISFSWVRVAVAAAVIIAAGLLWLGAEDENPVTPVPAIAGLENSSKDSGGMIEKSEKEGTPKIESKEIPSASVDINSTSTTRDEIHEQAIPQANKSVAKNEKAVTYATLDRNNNIVVPDNTDPGTQTVTEEIVATKPIVDLPVSDELQSKDASAMNVKTNYVTEALYREGGNATEEMQSDDQKQRKGLRGIVRKVNRFYNKATNPDPAKAVVKVANFEIGLPR
jgi:hypothetical protein